MKRIKYILLSILIFLSCIKNINYNKELFLEISDNEDNDTFSKAKEVSIQASIVGFFNNKGEKGDKDYYKIFFPQTYIPYKIILSSVPAIDSKMVFYTIQGKKILELDQEGRGESEKLWEYYPTMEYLILSVESKYGFNEKIPYVINFIPKEEARVEEIEPNNDEKSAITIYLSDVKKGLIAPKNDVDYYKLVFKDNRNYDFFIRVETLSNLDINFTIFNPRTNMQKYINNYSWAGAEIFPYLSSKNGEFYIRISGSINENDKKMPLYYLTIEEHKKESENIFFEQEFNDTFETATDLINDSYTYGTYFPEDDIDFFKIDVIKDTNSVTISISDVRDMNPVIELFDNKFNVIKRVDDKKNDRGEEIFIKNLARGRYYVAIKSPKASLTYYKMFFNIRYE